MSDDERDLFDDPSPARSARDEALDRVTANSSVWMAHALALIRDSIFGEMTGEEMRLQLGRLGLPQPHHHNAWGALTNTAIRRHLLEKTGQHVQMRTKRSHARSTPVLRRIA